MGGRLSARSGLLLRSHVYAAYRLSEGEPGMETWILSGASSHSDILADDFIDFYSVQDSVL